MTLNCCKPRQICENKQSHPIEKGSCAKWQFHIRESVATILYIVRLIWFVLKINQILQGSNELTNGFLFMTPPIPTTPATHRPADPPNHPHPALRWDDNNELKCPCVKYRVHQIVHSLQLCKFYQSRNSPLISLHSSTFFRVWPFPDINILDRIKRYDFLSLGDHRIRSYVTLRHQIVLFYTNVNQITITF